MSGLFTVVGGLDELRQLCGKPTFIAAARSSVVLLGLWVRSLFIKPKPVNYIITPMNIESRTEVSGGRVTVHGGPLDQRVANLESAVEALWERLEKAKSDIRKLRYDAEKGLENEIGRAHVRTPVTNAHLVSRLMLEKKLRNEL